MLVLYVTTQSHMQVPIVFQEELSAVKAAAEAAQQHNTTITEQAAQISHLQAAVSSLRSQYDASQTALFEALSQQEAVAGSSSSMEELMAEEMDKAAKAIAELTRQRDALAKQLAAVQQQQQQPQLGTASGRSATAKDAVSALPDLHGSSSSSSSMTTSDVQILQRQLHEKDAELTVVQQQLQAAYAQLHEAQQQQQLITSRFGAAESHSHVLKQELQQLRSQLQALHALVGQQLQLEGWSEDTVANFCTHDVESLQPALQERNRILSEQLHSLRQELSTCKQANLSLEANVASLQQQLSNAQQLVTQLEADLVSSTTDGNSQAAGYNSSMPLKIVSAVADGSSSATTLCEDDMPHTASDMLPVVISQRDRFRARIDALEGENEQLNSQLADAQRHLEASAADNVGLYEKIKYLEAYSREHAPAATAGARTTVIKVDDAGVMQQQQHGTAGSSNRYQCGPVFMDFGGRGETWGAGLAGSKANVSYSSAADSNGVLRTRGAVSRRLQCFGGGDNTDAEVGDLESKYSQAYAARLNPFAEFKQNESEAQLKQLQLHDKALLAGSKLIMGNRVARVFVACYAVFLHAFIMVLLYSSATPHVILAEMSAGSSQGVVAGSNSHAATAGTAVQTAALTSATGRQLLMAHHWPWL